MSRTLDLASKQLIPMAAAAIGGPVAGTIAETAELAKAVNDDLIDLTKKRERPEGDSIELGNVAKRGNAQFNFNPIGKRLRAPGQRPSIAKRRRVTRRRISAALIRRNRRRRRYRQRYFSRYRRRYY